MVRYLEAMRQNVAFLIFIIKNKIININLAHNNNSMAAKLKRFPLNLVLFGPPGVGKGVYCSLMEKDFKLRAFSTGDYMRTVLHTKEHPLFTR